MSKMLRYVEGTEPGYTRRRKGKGWLYIGPSGRVISSQKVIRRLNSLALPPAYSDAWYATDPDAHLQATGYDDRGRKQYRYHDEFRRAQEESKYDGCADFGEALPAIRKAVEKALRSPKLGKDRVVAAVVRILDLGKVRIGNESYTRDNRSFGATTLRNRHAKIADDKIILDYVGKSGKRHRITIQDRRLATVVKRCQEMPGQALFQYLENGNRYTVSSDDVNQWLREVSGSNFTAKSFRTWGASVIAYDILSRIGGGITLRQMLEEVSDKLGNTPAIARKSYVHPALIDLLLEKKEESIDLPRPRKSKYLSSAERGLIAFLKECRKRA